MRGQTSLFFVVFLVIVLSILGVFLIINYNGLVKTEKAVEEAQAQIATVCQRRLDLLPNLIETVKAYAKHEKETFIAVTQARTKAKSALDAVSGEIGSSGGIKELAASQAALTKSIRGIFALVENYPNLRSSSNFMALQDQFEGTENRITVARQRYNHTVRNYNTKIETFPGVFLAPMFDFREKEFYEAKKNAYEPVKASF